MYSYRIDKLSAITGQIIEEMKNVQNDPLINTDKDENNEELIQEKLKVIFNIIK